MSMHENPNHNDQLSKVHSITVHGYMYIHNAVCHSITMFSNWLFLFNDPSIVSVVLEMFVKPSWPEVSLFLAGICGSCNLVCVCEWVRVAPFCSVCDVFRAAGRFGWRPRDCTVRTTEAGHDRGPAVARWWVHSQQVRWEGYIIYIQAHTPNPYLILLMQDIPQS